MTLAHRNTAIEVAQATSGADIPSLTIDQVRLMATAAHDEARTPRLKDRDELLVQTLFDGAFRASEVIQITAESLHQTASGGWAAWIMGKGSKRAEVGISASLAARLQAFAFRQAYGARQPLFDLHRTGVHRICMRALRAAAIAKPPNVGAAHVLRHSGLLELLRQTGNPKAVQDHARHADARMTIRYMKTLSAQESLKIRQAVDFAW